MDLTPAPPASTSATIATPAGLPGWGHPHCDAVRRIPGGKLDSLIEREWLVTNGLGGYSSGTLAGAATRRYHGILVAAHPAPLGRIVMLSNITEEFRFPDWSTAGFGGTERTGGTADVRGADGLAEFRLELGLPVWSFRSADHIIEKRIVMPHRRNIVHIQYRLIRGDGPVRLKLRPIVHFRGYEDPVSEPHALPYTLTASEGQYELRGHDDGYPPLRMKLEGDGAALTLDGIHLPNVLFRVEESRGYENVGTVYSPGLFRVNLKPGQDVTLTASTEDWNRTLAMTASVALAAELERRGRLIAAAAPHLRSGIGAELVLAADQFIISPAARVQETSRAQAAGDEARTIIAGYHWFTDWGRDTMISLEGLTLTTGRHTEAGYILRTFIGHVRNGLIPNYFPDGKTAGVYHTADATLWFFHALSRYLAITGDRGTLRAQLPILKEIVAAHKCGTDFGIGVDPADGLLRQGAPGYQLTWMDAKVGDWVVTPRRGKAVEINALWYNALRLLEGWLREEGDGDAVMFGADADRAQASFNARFPRGGDDGLFDIVDGESESDGACRPNQIFSVSLPHPVLDREHWAGVVKVVKTKLLTPVGLRSLAPGSPDYKPKYFGDLRARDAAYHQGTVWAWLIGPFIDAWSKTHPEAKGECRQFLSGFAAHLNEACIGTISEVFDAEAPFTPRGCAAQAWSVSEVLRCWNLTAESC